MHLDTHFNSNWLNSLLKNPEATITGTFNSHAYTAKIAIPEYQAHLLTHYKDIIKGDLKAFSDKVGIPFNFLHFGVIIKFDEPTELELHDHDMVLNEGLKQLIALVGAVIIKNCYMTSKHRSQGHRNRFPHLNFHIDRSANQPTQYSMYTRDPFDEEQKFPRTSSTLFAPCILGHLQAAKEHQLDPDTDKGLKGTYTIFTQEDMSTVLNNVALEHAWNEPQGVGEISMLDNRTALHASYYRELYNKGYKIGVRYLA